MARTVETDLAGETPEVASVYAGQPIAEESWRLLGAVENYALSMAGAGPICDLNFPFREFGGANFNSQPVANLRIPARVPAGAPVGGVSRVRLRGWGDAAGGKITLSCATDSGSVTFADPGRQTDYALIETAGAVVAHGVSGPYVDLQLTADGALTVESLHLDYLGVGESVGQGAYAPPALPAGEYAWALPAGEVVAADDDDHAAGLALASDHVFDSRGRSDHALELSPIKLIWAAIHTPKPPPAPPESFTALGPAPLVFVAAGVERRWFVWAHVRVASSAPSSLTVWTVGASGRWGRLASLEIAPLASGWVGRSFAAPTSGALVAVTATGASPAGLVAQNADARGALDAAGANVPAIDAVSIWGLP